MTDDVDSGPCDYAQGDEGMQGDGRARRVTGENRVNCAKRRSLLFVVLLVGVDLPHS